MSKSEPRPVRRAVALQYGANDAAPVVVASGMGYLAEKIVEVAADSGVPVYEDNSLSTMLSQLQLGQEIPESLYRAVVEIYVYFLNFDPTHPERLGRPEAEPPPEEAQREEPRREEEAQ